MRKFLTIALMAVATVPTVATAQSRELQRDRRDIREERQDLRQAYRRGDRGDVRDARGDVREAQREYREDINDRNRRSGPNDWRNYRQNHRSVYARGNWRAPFAYRRFKAGYRIQPSFYGSRYVISDPYRYRLPPARANARWVRHYNDVLLVDYRRNVVLSVLSNFFL